MERGKHVVQIKQDFVQPANSTNPNPGSPDSGLSITKGLIVNILKRERGMLYGEYTKRRETSASLTRHHSSIDLQTFCGWFPENVAEFVPILSSKGEYGNIYKG